MKTIKIEDIKKMKLSLLDKLKYDNEWSDSVKHMYDEIFIRKTYFKEFIVKEGDIVVDLGANVGVFSLLADKYNPYKCYVVEPSKKIFKYLVTNIVDNSTDPSKYIFCNCGISKDTEIINFNDNTVPFVNLKESGSTSIKTFNFIDFVKFYDIKKIDFLKVDIEGYERYVFGDDENLDYIKNNVKNICGEMHSMFGDKVKKFDELYKIIENIKRIGFKLNFYSIDGIDITDNIMNNRVLSGGIKSSEYYNEFIFHAKNNE